MPNIIPKAAAPKQKIKLKFSKLVGYQRKIVDAPQRFTITEASTKVGKTYSHIV
ncbi:hypothetical protein [Runella sp.]|uniref:hypothetical protein n=1 Tax=Runella sp. TaxID=1960881 RepID=UPI003D0D9E63